MLYTWRELLMRQRKGYMYSLRGRRRRRQTVPFLDIRLWTRLRTVRRRGCQTWWCVTFRSRNASLQHVQPRINHSVTCINLIKRLAKTMCKTRCSRRRQTPPLCRHLTISTKHNVVTSSDVRLVPLPGELYETYTSSLILAIGSIMWKHDVIHKTGST